MSRHSLLFCLFVPLTGCQADDPVDPSTGSTTSASSSSGEVMEEPELPLHIPDLPPEREPDTDRDLYVFVMGDVLFLQGDFLTSSSGAADERCTKEANSAHLPGKYRAWISHSGDSPALSFTRTSGQYKLPDETPIAYGWDDLVDGELLTPIHLTQHGVEIGPYYSEWARENLQGVWTGTLSNGEPARPSQAHLTANCREWTSLEPSGQNGHARFGLADSVTEWSYVEDPDNSVVLAISCRRWYSIYCFEQ